MDPIVLRFFERITVVLIGAMAIYLGYRLFKIVPEQKDSAGQIVLPLNFSIIINRVGPGVVFALFGISAVTVSLIKPLSIEKPDQKIEYISGIKNENNDSKADQRAKLRREMAVLNTIPMTLSDKADSFEIYYSLIETKLLLMKPVWGTPEEGFGDFLEFEEWAKNGESTSRPKNMKGALDLYFYGSKKWLEY
jgi:hypothetical protein